MTSPRIASLLRTASTPTARQLAVAEAAKAAAQQVHDQLHPPVTPAPRPASPPAGTTATGGRHE